MAQHGNKDDGSAEDRFRGPLVGARPALASNPTKLGRGPLLEVVVSSVSDSVAAEEGGAHRLELVSAIEEGGLTPDLGLVRAVRAVVRIPFRVMVRDNTGFGVRDEAEARHLYAFAQELARLGVNGLVLGFIQEGKVDLALLFRILSAAPLLNATFHRAFDEAAHSSEALVALKSCEQIDRILTAGGAGDLEQRARQLENWRTHARPEITVMAGGGLDAAALRYMRAHTEIREFHVGRAARAQPNWEAPVDAARVHELAAILRAPAAAAGGADA